MRPATGPHSFDAECARAYSEQLVGPIKRRWAHTQGVAERARALGERLIAEGSERDVLVASAWLHDVGYAPALVVTGCHHLDGARHLAELGQVRLACLVAHHGSADAEARLRGLRVELGAFPPEASRVADLLTYCDLVTSPDGRSVALDERLAEVEKRYGAGHVVTCGLIESRPDFCACFARVETALARTTTV